MRLRLVVPADVETPTGGNVYDLRVARDLRALGVEVALVRSDPDGLDGALTAAWDGPTLVDGMLVCAAPRAVGGARTAVLVHMPSALRTGLAPERAARLDRLEREALHAAARVLTTSHWCARHLQRHHGVRATVAAPGVDEAPVASGSSPPLLVHLASVVPHKDQLAVVTALSRLADLPWHARLAGPTDRDPQYVRRVRAAVTAAGLDGRVEVTGTMAPDAAYAGADLALLPSLVESYGMVVTEALARAIPAVVSATGAEEALGRTRAGTRPGVVVGPGDTTALEAALRRWLTDGGHRDSLRTAALARRTTLERWDETARCVRDALLGL